MFIIGAIEIEVDCYSLKKTWRQTMLTFSGHIQIKYVAPMEMSIWYSYLGAMHTCMVAEWQCMEPCSVLAVMDRFCLTPRIWRFSFLVAVLLVEYLCTYKVQWCMPLFVFLLKSYGNQQKKNICLPLYEIGGIRTYSRGFIFHHGGTIMSLYKTEP